MKYYRLLDDINFNGRWYLGEIIDTDDNWQFTIGQKVNELSFDGDLHIDLYKDGKAMDYTTNEAYSVPIVSEQIKLELSSINGLQFIPVKVNGKEVVGSYYVMIVTKKKSCVNEELSEFGKFVENDPIRPDKAGHYSWFTKLIIDPALATGEDIFRIDKAELYLVVSERVKEAMENINATGTKFIEV
jgi:hypothetical protein